MTLALRFTAVAAMFITATNAHAVMDPSGDLLASFTGAHSGASDILSADFTFDPTAGTFLLHTDGTGKMGAPAIPVTIAGDDIRQVVSASLLPSNGLDAKDCTWALWSVGSSIAGLPRNADIAPGANIEVVVPEPEPYAMMLAALGVLGFVARRRATIIPG